MTYVMARRGDFVASREYPPASHTRCAAHTLLGGSPMRRIIRTTAPTHRPRLTAVVVAALLAGCAPHDSTGPGLAATGAGTTSAEGAIWADSVQGTTEEGALYKMLLPTNWNGQTVFYAHGIRDAALPIVLGETQDRFAETRDLLGAKGYAVAYSSWAENGYAVKNGVQSTRQLRGLFADTYGQPERAYLMGHSLGGLVVQNIAEKFPNGWDGALPMCAPLGGTAREIQYIGDVRAVFDALFPGVLPGDASGVPAPGLTPAQVQGLVLQEFARDPAGFQAKLGVMANLVQTPLPGATANQLVESLITALGFHARGVADLTDRAHGHLPFDNQATIYALRAGLPAPVQQALQPLVNAINAGVDRYEITPDAARFRDKYYLPTGDLQMPTITIHNMFDPVVPAFHEADFAAAVAGAGKSSLLEQRTAIAPYGHCRIEPSEVIAAFDALVARVEGMQP